MSVAAGRKCVEMVAEICQQLGYGVYVPEKETCGPWDMKVNGERVQVKLRGVCTQQPNRIRLKTYMGSGTVAYRMEDVDAFVIRWSDRWYVVPSHFIATRGGDIMNAVYMPSIAGWIDKWCLFEGERVAYEQQKSFDF